MSHDGETWRWLYTAMARLVSLAKATWDLGRCRHCRCAPLVIAWPGFSNKEEPRHLLSVGLCFHSKPRFLWRSLHCVLAKVCRCIASITSLQASIKMCPCEAHLHDRGFPSPASNPDSMWAGIDFGKSKHQLSMYFLHRGLTNIYLYPSCCWKRRPRKHTRVVS